ncbi:hypothetical protein FKM82_005276 [Ascaphus truei]
MPLNGERVIRSFPSPLETVKHLSGAAAAAEYRVELLSHPNESRSAAQLLQFGGSHVGASGADPPQDVSDGMFHVPSERDFHSLSLRGPEERTEE